MKLSSTSFDLRRLSGAPLLPALALALMVAGSVRAQPFDCLIEPRQVVELRSPVEGVIEHIHAERGGSVRKGQVLVELESSVERSNVLVARQRAEMRGRIESARNRVEFAVKKLERAQQLIEDNYLSAQARDEAMTERRLAEAELLDAEENQQLARLELRRAEDQLNLRSIKSPFDGYVVDRLLQPGELAEAGSGRKPLLKLAQIDVLLVEVVVPQAARGQVRVGSRLLVRPEGGKETLSATVTVVDRVLDAASGTFNVRLELPNPKGTIMAGAHCTTEFSAKP
jgi:RND family efflux transporter MFP subunit